MDEFVCNILTELDLGEYIPKFKEQGINERSLMFLKDQDIENLFDKVGPRAIFRDKHERLLSSSDTSDTVTKKIQGKRRLCLQGESSKSPSRTSKRPSHTTPGSHSEFQGKKKLYLQRESSKSPSSTSKRPSRNTPGSHSVTKKIQGKRKLDFQRESSKSPSQTSKRPCHTTPGSHSEEIILSDVKEIMRKVDEKIPSQDNNKLNAFLKKKISALEIDKRELVGVFGKTGAGKSSLINAVIQKNLLPTGIISACTSVMIEVEANTESEKYEAHIKFITVEEWGEELTSYQFHKNDQEHDEAYHETVQKLSALYGEEYKKKSPDDLMDKKYFKEIQEFLQPEKGPKILKSDKPGDLADKISKYTRTGPKEGKGKKGKQRWYWPLVKCVTVKVPDNDLLKYVTLVDLPGNGDRNKSRDEMWKEVVGKCSTVWIVTEITRATSEKEAWEILERTIHLMGNGGECQTIHFICTKSDLVAYLGHSTALDVYARISEQNNQTKEQVTEDFKQNENIKKHFSDDNFEVFTVSSQEFERNIHLNPDDTEIPKLQDFLRNLNDHHSETLNYVRGAHGILSLITEASGREVVDQKIKMCTDLKEKMRHDLGKVRTAMEDSFKVFEECLSKGVEKSLRSCQEDLRSIIRPNIKNDRGFHQTLKSVVTNNGSFTQKTGRQIDLNMKLASHLTDSIDDEFKKTFPNDRTRQPFNGIINTFSIETKKLIKEHKEVELPLEFLGTEEVNIKAKLNKTIRHRKKDVYRSLVTTIKTNMEDCYKKAKKFKGKKRLEKMRGAIENHVDGSKNTMFEEAKKVMLEKLSDLKEEILKTLEDTMTESIEMSLRTDGDSIPGFPHELEKVKKYLSDLQRS